MSSENAIQVENLNKCYQIYDQAHDRLKQSIYPRLQRIAGRSPSQYFREFWALKDISFEIKKGETVGIMGRNGSGKSTLLQMICGTLNPTSGNIHTNGRIAALLELGSGFNPEFTGRENVYMNAEILGLSREEIDARLDNIFAFADIGVFIDQPVKTYSSGMYVRLAFSVVVHVDADILIVDEALAVGDAFFTQKCMVQIKKLMGSGVTLLFVSHDSNAVKALCSRALLLENGKLISKGKTKEVVEAYYGKFVQTQQENFSSQNLPITPSQLDTVQNALLSNNEAFQKRSQFQRLQNGKADFLNIKILDTNGLEIQNIEFNQTVILQVVFTTNFDLSSLNFAYHIRDKNGFDLVYSDTMIEQCPLVNPKAGDYYVADWQFRAALAEGQYSISCMLSTPKDLSLGHVEVCDFIPIAAQVKVGRAGVSQLYGAVHWTNQVNCRIVETKSSQPFSS